MYPQPEQQSRKRHKPTDTWRITGADACGRYQMELHIPKTDIRADFLNIYPQEVRTHTPTAPLERSENSILSPSPDLGEPTGRYPRLQCQTVTEYSSSSSESFSDIITSESTVEGNPTEYQQLEKKGKIKKPSFWRRKWTQLRTLLTRYRTRSSSEARSK